ncbi:MAG TPA: hypothetical protein VES65_11325 [Solirubrobacteraceae bacterium]|nr:hypothetical protein [Solirubrobacteraceae bacterium]
MNKAVLIVLLGCTAQVAFAQDSVPSDAELRSAYCIPVLQWAVKGARDIADSIDGYWRQNPPTSEFAQQVARTRADARKSVSDEESVLNRLQAYLLPRMERLDPVALTLAMKRGEADLREFESVSNQCTKQCGVTVDTPSRDEKSNACLETCRDKDKALVERVRACNAPTWLPF